MIPYKNIIIGSVLAAFCPSEHAYVLMNLTTCLLFCMHSQLGLADYVSSQIINVRQMKHFSRLSTAHVGSGIPKQFYTKCTQSKIQNHYVLLFSIFVEKNHDFHDLVPESPSKPMATNELSRHSVQFSHGFEGDSWQNHENEKFFERKSKKAKRSRFGIYLVCKV